MSPEFARQVLAVVHAIPEGRVCTYGRVAELAGFPRHARHVGKLLSGSDEVPWQRVVAAGGRIARAGTEAADWQRLLLEHEGIVFGESGRIDLLCYGWPKIDAIGV